jgi:hypothetical protein
MPQSTVSLQTDPRSLYSRCEDRERKILAWDLAALKNQLMSALAFGVPPFLSLKTVPQPTGPTQKGEKFDLPPSTYLNLVRSLRDARNNDDLWFLIALWFKEEAIREPEDFLPPATYKRLTRRVRERFQGISFTDMRYFELVRCWEPYFLKLLEDREGLRHNTANPKKELLALGYVPKSVELVMRKRWRSAVELAFEWLADRQVIRPKNNDPDPISTLRNAYSRIKAGASKVPSTTQRESLSHRHDQKKTKYVARLIFRIFRASFGITLTPTQRSSR